MNQGGKRRGSVGALWHRVVRTVLPPARNPFEVWRAPEPGPRLVPVPRQMATHDWDFLLAQGDAEALIRAGIENARQHSPELQLAWGRMLLSGHGTAQDLDGARAAFAAAASAGLPAAINMLGRCHELGWGGAIDPAAAAVLYGEAAAAGDAWARFNLGSLLHDGEGIAQDRARALQLFVQAARQGHGKAMNMLGSYCEAGWAGRIRPVQAFHWYRRAAHRHDFRGQYNHGRQLYLMGAEAAGLVWIERAIHAGVPAFRADVEASLRASGRPDLMRLADLARSAPQAVALPGA